MRYYCHHCHTQINADELLPEFTCPSCQSGFVEEIPVRSSRRNSSVDESNRSVSDDGNQALNSNRMSSDEYSDDNSDVEFLEAVNLSQVLNFFQSHQQSNSPASNNPAGQSSQSELEANAANTNSNSTAQRMVTRSVNRTLGLNTPGQIHTTAYLDPNQTLSDVLNDFITGVSFGTHYPEGNPASSQTVQGSSGSGPANRGLINIDFPLPFFLHSNPGDYAWGNAGFDAVITQLLNNLDGSSSGPPPMPKNQVDKLPTVKISDEQVKHSNLQCTVCMDDFQIGDIARQLPCEHFFHQDCIVPWLSLHASCPICRKTFTQGNAIVPPSSDAPRGTATASTTNTNVNLGATPPTLSDAMQTAVEELRASTRNPTSSAAVQNDRPNYDYTEDDCD